MWGVGGEGEEGFAWPLLTQHFLSSMFALQFQNTGCTVTMTVGSDDLNYILLGLALFFFAFAGMLIVVLRVKSSRERKEALEKLKATPSAAPTAVKAPVTDNSSTVAAVPAAKAEEEIKAEEGTAIEMAVFSTVPPSTSAQHLVAIPSVSQADGPPPFTPGTTAIELQPYAVSSSNDPIGSASTGTVDAPNTQPSSGPADTPTSLPISL